MSETIIQDIAELTGGELRDLVDKLRTEGKNKPESVLKEELTVVLDEMNRRAKTVAKKYGKRFYPFTLEDIGHKDIKVNKSVDK